MSTISSARAVRPTLEEARSEGEPTESILYVDDDPLACRAFQRTLHHTGFRIDTAASGYEAIELVGRTAYAVVATDLKMPGMDGVELIDRLHTEAHTASFVLVTGVLKLDLPTDTESARSITCVVQKPWVEEELEGALRRAIDLHRTRNRARRATCNEATSNRVSVLLIEDNPGDARLVQRMLARAPGHDYEMFHVKRLEDALSSLEAQPFQLVLVDLSLPDARGMDSVTRLQAMVPSVPIIVMSGLSDEELAVHAVQIGAQDYLVKGEVDARALHRAIRYAVQRKATEERLAQLAHYDQLTGLANRTTFREHARRALARARRHPGTLPAIFMLDLDRFKAVNDTLGHDTGDSLLVRVGERLTSAVRRSDTVARLGGDEFAVLIEDIKKEDQIATPAQHIIEALGPEVYLDEHEVRVTTSIGIAVFPENGETVEELLKNADSAMYRAKEKGRNNYQFFNKEMHARAVRRMGLERDLCGALEREEFTIHYQPLNKCASGQPVCFEALLRWEHPRMGMIQPGQFVPLLENMGQIVPVGEWVLRRACAQVRRWQDDYDEELRVAVNVSPRQFDDPDLVTKVVRALRAANVSPGSLELEVTESLVMRDIEAAIMTLQRLKSLGVRVAIDDFGTGYSQLVYLVRFPIDTLKIDRSVVQMIGSHEGNTVAKTVIDMGHNLGLEVVAEGVEEISQLKFLQDQRCGTFQGYLATKALAPADAEVWLRDTRPS